MITSVGVFGVILNILWILVNQRQMEIGESVREVLEDVSTVYRLLRDRRPRSWYSSISVLAYWVPATAAVIWIVLLALAFWGPSPQDASGQRPLVVGTATSAGSTGR